MSKSRKQYVVLVNEKGKRIGVAEKMEAHRKGLLHRAFSIFLFNERKELLLQQRAAGKYHFAGLWSNACCSHPRPGEKILTSAGRRLREELNIQTKLKITSSIIYHLFDERSQLHEHEFDFILCGKIAEQHIPFNKKEIAAVRWISIQQLKKELKEKPELFTPWLPLTLKKIKL